MVLCSVRASTVQRHPAKGVSANVRKEYATVLQHLHVGVTQKGICARSADLLMAMLGWRPQKVPGL